MVNAKRKIAQIDKQYKITQHYNSDAIIIIYYIAFIVAFAAR